MMCQTNNGNNWPHSFQDAKHVKFKRHDDERKAIPMIWSEWVKWHKKKSGRDREKREKYDVLKDFFDQCRIKIK